MFVCLFVFEDHDIHNCTLIYFFPPLFIFLILSNSILSTDCGDMNYEISIHMEMKILWNKGQTTMTTSKTQRILKYSTNLFSTCKFSSNVVLFSNNDSWYFELKAFYFAWKAHSYLGTLWGRTVRSWENSLASRMRKPRQVAEQTGPEICSRYRRSPT